jgi:hypothetical protein
MLLNKTGDSVAREEERRMNKSKDDGYTVTIHDTPPHGGFVSVSACQPTFFESKNYIVVSDRPNGSSTLE